MLNGPLIRSICLVGKETFCPICGARLYRRRARLLLYSICSKETKEVEAFLWGCSNCIIYYAASPTVWDIGLRNHGFRARTYSATQTESIKKRSFQSGGNAVQTAEACEQGVSTPCIPEEPIATEAYIRGSRRQVFQRSSDPIQTERAYEQAIEEYYNPIQWKVEEEPQDVREQPCSVRGCNNSAWRDGFCWEHFKHDRYEVK